MSPRDICAAVAQKHGLQSRQITRDRGKQPRLVRARDEAISLIRTRHNYSYTELGRMFGMNHTSIMAAVRRAPGVTECEPRMTTRELVQEIRDLRARVEYLEQAGLGLA